MCLIRWVGLDRSTLCSQLKALHWNFTEKLKNSSCITGWKYLDRKVQPTGSKLLSWSYCTSSSNRFWSLTWIKYYFSCDYRKCLNVCLRSSFFQQPDEGLLFQFVIWTENLPKNIPLKTSKSWTEKPVHRNKHLPLYPLTVSLKL